MKTMLPLLDDERAISPAQQEVLRKDGHLLIRSLLSYAEVAAFRPLIRELVKKTGPGKALNCWRQDTGVRKLILSRRLALVAAALLGVGNVRLYHDQALFEEPGSHAIPWHQDQYSWPLDTARTITLYLPLTDISIEMGMLTFASGSHQQGTVMVREAKGELDSGFRKNIRENQFPVNRAAAMRAGDATWFYGNTLHCVPANQSNWVRELMTVVYMADGARITPPANVSQEREQQLWLNGLPAGRPAASELNPLLL